MTRLRSDRLSKRTSVARKFRSTDFLNFVEQLSQMLLAGISFGEAFLDFSLRGSKHVQALARQGLAAVEEGRSIAAIFRFKVNTATLNAFTTAERVGHLPEALQNFVNRQRHRQAWTTEVTRSLSYPVLLFAMCFLLALFVRFHIEPELWQLQRAIGHQENQNTWVNSLVSNLPFLLIAMLLMAPVLYVSLFLLREHMGWMHVRLPFDSLLLNIRMEEMVYLIAMQLEAGNSLLEALETLGNSGRSRWLVNTSTKTMQDILQGKPLSEALEAVCPTTMYNFIRTGEATGDLVTALTYAELFLEKSIANSFKRIAAWLEPCAMGFMGLVVSSVMYGLFGPMYQSISSVGKM